MLARPVSETSFSGLRARRGADRQSAAGPAAGDGNGSAWVQETQVAGGLLAEDMMQSQGLALRDSLRDRTGEFRAAVDNLIRSRAPVASAVTTSSDLRNSQSGVPSSSSSTSKQREFAQKASRVGMGIHSTSQKLAQLAKLAKRTSMFDDPTQQINELTAVIKQDITNMNNEIAELQMLNAAGNKQSSEHSTSVVTNLKGRLMDTTKEFKDVLTLRTDSLKVHESRQAAMYSPGMRSRAQAGGGGHVPFAGAPNASGGAGQQPTLFSSAARVAKQPPGGSGQASTSSLGHPFDPSANSQQQQQQQLLLRQEDTYMNSRAEALQNVESTITELGGMFQQLATMVQQQQEVAIRIDQDVDETMTNVEGAQAQLLKYLDRISGNRWLVLKIFFVLMAFMTVFVLFVA